MTGDAFRRMTIARQRFARQRITCAPHRRVADVVSWLGAVQAQEYDAAKWGLGLRMVDGVTDAHVERAFAAGRILRTHVMRPTWHFVTPADIRWMLELTGPRVQQRMLPYKRHLELDATTLTRGTAVIERALGDDGYLTRTELAERLRLAGVGMAGQRLAHLVMHAELEGVICSGPRRGREFTYALIAARAPRALRLPRDEALAMLTRRFFTSHGPATIRDFVWWSGLITADARRGVEMIGARRVDAGGRSYWTAGRVRVGTGRHGRVELLPIYDEFIVAYRDRAAVSHGPSLLPAGTLPVNFQHALVIAGHVAGTWRTQRDAHGTTVLVYPLRRLTGREQDGVGRAVRRYAGFLASPVDSAIHGPATSRRHAISR